MEKLETSMKTIFGNHVPRVLKDHLVQFQKGRALDVGCANGAVTDFLRENGFEAVGIDIDPPQSRISEFIRRADIRTFEIKNYALIVALNVLQFLRYSERMAVLSNFRQGVLGGGFLILESFTTEDEGYKAFKSQGAPETEPRTFWNPRRNGIASYFLPGELRAWAEGVDLEIVHYNEQTIQDDHPPMGPHTHGIVTAILKKPTV